MSAESQAIFHRVLHDPESSLEELQAAATGHLGASRSLPELMALYAQAVEAGDALNAQALADELQPVRAAGRVVAGMRPGGGSN